MSPNHRAARSSVILPEVGAAAALLPGGGARLLTPRPLSKALGPVVLSIAAGCTMQRFDYLTRGTEGDAGSAGMPASRCETAGASCGGGAGGTGAVGEAGTTQQNHSGAGTAGVDHAKGGAGGTLVPTAGVRGLPGGAGGAAGQGGAGGVAGSSGAAGAAGIAGSSGAAGTAGSAGSNAAAGTTGTGGTSVEQCEGVPGIVGPATRPQLTAEAARQFTVAKYLARAGVIGELTDDGWDPTAGLGDVADFVPTFTVAADGSGTHTTLQEAVTAAAESGETSRAYILVAPGTYREVVCVDGARPITIYGADEDASAVQIVFGNHAAKAVDDDVNPCATPLESEYGLSASATFAAKSNDLELKNLTIVNDYVEDPDPWTGGQQAAAMLTLGDRIVLENVRLLGNHNTTHFYSPDPRTVSRVYVKDSYFEGDMQFITGRATLVVDDSEIHSLTDRTEPPLGSVIAASTAAQNPYGFLVINSRFTVGQTTDSDWVLIGRSWDEDTGIYDVSSNGQVVIRECSIGSHIKKLAPWGNALETVRIFDCHENRLFEYANSGPGAWEP